MCFGRKQIFLSHSKIYQANTDVVPFGHRMLTEFTAISLLGQVSAIFRREYSQSGCLGIHAQSTGLILTITAEFYDNLSGCDCIQMGNSTHLRGQGLVLALVRPMKPM